MNPQKKIKISFFIFLVYISYISENMGEWVYCLYNTDF